MNDEQLRFASLTIAARTGVDPRTVGKMLRGGRVRLSVRIAIESAARELGVAIPEASRPEGGA